MNQKMVPWWLKAAVYVMFALCLGMGTFLVVGLLRSRSHFRALNERLTREGYERVVYETAIVSNRLERPTWFVPENGTNALPVPSRVELLQGANASVAIFAATGLVRGVVRGDLLFVGRTLILEDDAVIESNLITTCWMLQHFGQVRGEIQGTRNFVATNRETVAAMGTRR